MLFADIVGGETDDLPGSLFTDTILSFSSEIFLIIINIQWCECAYDERDWCSNFFKVPR